MRLPTVFLHIYSSIKIYLIIFSIISLYANQNYFKLKIAKKIFNLKYKNKFKDMFSLYSLKKKVNEE